MKHISALLFKQSPTTQEQKQISKQLAQHPHYLQAASGLANIQQELSETQTTQQYLKEKKSEIAKNLFPDT